MLSIQAALRASVEALLKHSLPKGQTYRTVLDQSEVMSLIPSSAAVSRPFAQLVPRSTSGILQPFEAG